MTNEFEYSKMEIADAHFDAACKAFLSNGHPSVIVTLAGVAEEIYGALSLATLLGGHESSNRERSIRWWTGPPRQKTSAGSA